MVTMENKQGSDNVSIVSRGTPKSGRTWKSERTKRHSDLIRDKPLKTTWKEKMEIKAKQKLIKVHEKKLKEAKAIEKEEKRKRMELNRKRKLENEKNSEILQSIKNKAKIKRTRKKQLRKLKARK